MGDNLDVIKNNILNWVEDNFGIDFEFRKYQLESIMFIIKSIITDDRETSIIEAPTGSGKSLITIIAAGVLEKYYNLKSYILCSDLFLWQQYADVIDNMKLKKFGYLKGSQGNYTCFMNKQDLSNGRCRLMKISYMQLKNKDWRERNFFNCVDSCVYMQQRFRAEKSAVTLLTYQLWLYFMNYVNINDTKYSSFPARPVIFCDECHNIPNLVQQFCSPIINDVKDKKKLFDILNYAIDNNIDINIPVEQISNDFKHDRYIYNYQKEKIDDQYKPNTINKNYNKLVYNDIFDNKKIEDCINEVFSGLSIYNEDTSQILNILELYNSILEFIQYISTSISEEFENKTNTKNLTNEQTTILKRLTWFTTYSNSFVNYLRSVISSGIEYIILEANYNKETGETIYQFDCAKEDFLCNSYVLKHAKHKVLLSATVGLHHAFDENLGIKYTTQGVSYLSKIPSTFNFDNSPIYYIPTYKMSYYNKAQDFPKIIQMCIKILNATDKRGIIHTGSYENARMFYSSVPKEIQKRLFLYGDSKQKDEVMPLIKKTKNGVLVGPTLTEGIDLPNDYCRFIILMKIPYPNITSKIIKKKIELFADWYNNTTSNIIIQSLGRGIRNENDYCTTYILDGCFTNLYQQTKEQYPKYIRDRIKIIYS